MSYLGRFISIRLLSCVFFTVSLFISSEVAGVVPKTAGDPLDNLEFSLPEIYLQQNSVPIDSVFQQLPNNQAWTNFFSTYGSFSVYIDTKTWEPLSIIGHIPVIPGTGKDNTVTLAQLSSQLGYTVNTITPDVVATVIDQFMRNNSSVLTIDSNQLGQPSAFQVSSYLWEFNTSQQLNGIPVRGSRISASINHGNLIIFGTVHWKNVEISTTPTISEAQAYSTGFGYASGQQPGDQIWKQATLEILPVDLGGPSYSHRLVWVFGFKRSPQRASWEVMVDAHTGEMVSFRDVNEYLGKAEANIYPVTNTDICPSPDKCGTLQNSYPVPYAHLWNWNDNTFYGTTDSTGLFPTPSSSVYTILSGTYIVMTDFCGSIHELSSGPILNLGGFPNTHDCFSSGQSAGDTSATRSAYYELTKTAEMAQGWTTSVGGLFAIVNWADACNAYFDPNIGPSLNFFLSGTEGSLTCRNTGEIAGILDHEWGHALDLYDQGPFSNPSEAYADINAMYRLQASCIGHGFYSGISGPNPCGFADDGTGPNGNEAQVGSAHCDTDCSGVRDANYLKHSPNTPDTPTNFVCTKCNSDPNGLCNKEVHCAAAPVRQAAWDFATKDLTASPFNYDQNFAFLVASKIFFLGSRNVGNWYQCSCGSSSDGCNADSGYNKWLAADDTNGDPADGTPHMTALYNAFNRHGIACSTYTPQNSNCPQPGQISGLTVDISGGDSVSTNHIVDWTPASGADKYWVFRSEGFANCDFGKRLIAAVDAPTSQKTILSNKTGHQYCYMVVPLDSSSDACFGEASDCVCVVPPVDFDLSCFPAAISGNKGGSVNTTCTVTASGGFTSNVALSCTDLPSGVTCSYNPSTVDPNGGTVQSTLTVNIASNVNDGIYNFSAKGTSTNPGRTHFSPIQLTVAPPTFDIGCVPSDLTISKGSNGTTTCAITSTSGFNSAVNLSCLGLPSGVSCSFSPNPVTPPPNGAINSILTITVGTGTTAGTYPITVRGVSGPITKTFDLSLTVPPPDFTVTCNPASLTINRGSSGTSTVTIASVSGFNSSVSLSCPSGLPSGASCSFNPVSVTPPPNGQVNSILTITVGPNTTAGTYPVTVRGQGGGFTRTFSLTLIIPSPSFSISANPGSIVISRGSSGVTTTTVTSISAFNSSVSLSCLDLPSGVACSFNPSSVTPPANGSVNSTLTLTVGLNTQVDTYAVTIRGQSGSITKTFTLTLTVPPASWDVSCSPSSLEVSRGSSKISTCTVTSYSGFNSSVNLSCSGLPSGTSCSFNPSSVTPPANGTVQSQLTVQTSPSTPLGTRTFTVRAERNGTMVGFFVSLTVKSPTIQCTPGTITLDPDTGSEDSETISCTLTGVSGENRTVRCPVVPPNSNIVCDQTSGTIDPNGSLTLPFTIHSLPGALAAGYDLIIVASDQGGSEVGSFQELVQIKGWQCEPFTSTVSALPSDWMFAVGQGSWTRSDIDQNGTYDSLTIQTAKKGTALPATGNTKITKCSNCSIEADVQIGQPQGKMSLIGWYDALTKSRVELLLKWGSSKKLVLKQIVNGSLAEKRAVPFPDMATNTPFRVRVEFDGTSLSASVSGASISTITVPPFTAVGTPIGVPGFRARGTTGVFSNITVCYGCSATCTSECSCTEDSFFFNEGGEDEFSVTTGPTPSISLGDVLVIEGTTGSWDAQVKIQLSPATSIPLSLDYSTSDGTALAGEDYTAKSGTVSMIPGQSAKIVKIPIIADPYTEPSQTFNVNLSNLIGSGIIQDGQGIVTLEDDDTPEDDEGPDNEFEFDCPASFSVLKDDVRTMACGVTLYDFLNLNTDIAWNCNNSSSVQCTFQPQGNNLLNVPIDPGASTPVGDISNFTIAGVIDSTSRTDSLTLRVLDFQQSCPNPITVVKGGYTDSICSVGQSSNWSDSSIQVTWSCLGLPTGATCTFTQNPWNINYGSNVNLRIQTTTNTPVGNYNITVRGTSGAQVRTYSTLLKVVTQTTYTFYPIADSYITGDGHLNDNYGTQTNLRMQHPTNFSHVLVKFSQSSITSTIGTKEIVSANLKLYIETNFNNWGSGSNINVHRMTADWQEYISGSPAQGVTFSCAVDTNLGNTNPNCTTQWNGGSYDSTVLSSVLHQNNQTGWKIFDVKTDVIAIQGGSSHYGWLLKKPNYNNTGSVDYTSIQGTAANKPRLEITVNN